MKKYIVGVMGPGLTATPEINNLAHNLGKRLAKEGWVVLTGGRNAGVMNAACAGAKEAGGVTLGIIPNNDPDYVSEFVDFPIYTDVGLARNNINVMSSDIIVAICAGTSAGTTSEVALALNHKKDVIFLNPGDKCWTFFSELDPTRTFLAQSSDQVISLIKDRKNQFN